MNPDHSHVSRFVDHARCRGVRRRGTSGDFLRMITLKLPDGSARQVAPGTRPREVAESIGKRLAQAAVAAKVDGEIVDLDREISRPSPARSPFRSSPTRTPKSLDVLRHSCAHVMARAVMRLFPGAQLAFGPTLGNGFYYDIDSPTPIREEDFPRIEAEMEKIVDAGRAVRAVRAADRRGARRCVADLEQELQGRAHRRRAEAVSDRSASTARASSSTCAAGRTFRTPARSARSSCCQHRRRLLEERRQPQAAAAALRHRVLQPEGARRLPARSSKRPRSATIACSASSSSCSPSASMVGSGLILWMPKGAIVRGILETFIKDELVKRGYSAGLHPAHRPARAVSHQRALPVLPRRPVPADVLPRRRPARSTCAQYRLAAGRARREEGTASSRAT